MTSTERQEKLDSIFRKLRARKFSLIARKNGLNVPYSNELSPGMSLSLYLSDSITQGFLYDTDEHNDFVQKWYDEIFN